MSPPANRHNQAGNAIQHNRQCHGSYSPCRGTTDFCCYRSIYFKAVFHSQPQQNSFILPHREHTSLHIISPLPSSRCRNRKPRLFAAIGVFAFISFVNQKPADFVLCAHMAPCHFLVNYPGWDKARSPINRNHPQPSIPCAASNAAATKQITAAMYTPRALSRGALPGLSTAFRLHTSSV